jgi:hypothetical protein
LSSSCVKDLLSDSMAMSKADPENTELDKQNLCPGGAHGLAISTGSSHATPNHGTCSGKCVIRSLVTV